MKIVIIAAYGKNREIGYRNKLLWHISDDLKRFKQITSGHVIIMGRLTWESIGSKPLPNRRNIVLTSSGQLEGQQVETAASVEEALERLKDEQEVFIIGGAQIYRAFLPYADLMYLTWVHGIYRADSFFPAYPEEEWEIISRIDRTDDLQAGVNYSFVTLKRIQ